MLTKRQKQIVAILDKNRNSYVKGAWLARELNCSLKTLQNDIKEVKLLLDKNNIEIKSTTSKGYSLIIVNETDFQKFQLQYMSNNEMKDFNNQSYRITYILNELLKSDSYVKSDDLADQMYVSRSSISSDMKIVKKVLDKYHLTMEHKPNYGMHIVGLEKDKRLCIIKEHLDVSEDSVALKKERISIVTDIVVENLMRAKYRVSDIVLQNIVLHICVSIQRMKKNIYVENSYFKQNYADELVIAQKILKQLSTIYNFEVKEQEVSFLALNLLGKRSYMECGSISLEMDQFINDMLKEINDKMMIDFSGDIELKISLALHIVPLLVRLESHMQLQNTLVEDIRLNYPLAYDIAVIAAAYITKNKNEILSDDEIGYLATHFSLSLSKQQNKINPKRVLIICNARRGDYLMIQYTFLKEFKEMIADLKIVNALEVPLINIDEYDCIFTTFLNHPLIPKQAIRINFFVDNQDIKRIKNVLRGYNEKNELLKYFCQEYFMGVIEANDYVEVIRKMTDHANIYNNFDDNLFESCIRREKLGSTAYGQLIALPHPDTLISQKTVVTTAILKKPILWLDQKVQLVFLICVEKGNKKDLTILFEYISKFMMQQSNVQDVISDGNYMTLINKLSQSIY